MNTVYKRMYLKGLKCSANNLTTGAEANLMEYGFSSHVYQEEDKSVTHWLTAIICNTYIVEIRNIDHRW